VVGIVSLLIWALFFTVTLKYVFFLMRADNKGEGGTLSLMALAQNALGRRSKMIFLLGVAGAALFSGDAIITAGHFRAFGRRGAEYGLDRLPALCAADRRGHPGDAFHRPEQRNGASRDFFRTDHGGVLRLDRRPGTLSYRRRAAHPATLSIR